MFKNYLSIAIRSIAKQKGYSFINIVGLALGISCVLFILLYVTYEHSFDDYHLHRESIFRVAKECSTKSEKTFEALTTAPLAKALKEGHPEVECAARVFAAGSALVKNGQTLFFEKNHIFSDTELFEILSIPFLKGSPAAALDRPNTAVITGEVAKRYFGTKDVLGKTLDIDGKEYEITGVVKKSPGNTHLKYSIILSLQTYSGDKWMTSWWSNMIYTYIKLHPKTNYKHFENQIKKLSALYLKKEAKSMGYSQDYFLQPVKDIHLYSHLAEELETPGNPLYLLLYLATGILILIIAGCNFMNLSTARAANRAMEVGLRKVMGAVRRQLIVQFLGESLLVSCLAFCCGLVISSLALPYFNSLARMSFTLSDIFSLQMLVILLGITVIVGIGAGSYPAFLLSGFKPIMTLKGSVSAGARGALFRKILIFGQFAISVLLIIMTITVFKQLDFMKKRPLGFEQKQKLIVSLDGGISVSNNYETVKREFSAHSSITEATISSTTLGKVYDSQGVIVPEKADVDGKVVDHIYIDADFIPLYKIKMAAGRAFQKEITTDLLQATIINEAAARAFGFKSPQEAIGKKIGSVSDRKIRYIIGVTKDFHYMGLVSKIRPLVMMGLPKRFHVLTLSIEKENVRATMAFVKNKLKELFPYYPLEPYFLVEEFNRQYNKEEQIGMLLGTFSSIGLFIAALGLLGLASFTTVQRTKEIGIRKALGASVSGIILLLSKEFAKIILLSNLIAWPIAYYALIKWLEKFPYRTSVTLDVFIIPAVIVLVMAIFSVSYQAVKAAMTNPVKALKYE
ncbi:MAG: FtsX-like permease family protein [bacterium]|nr:FtsX-like permease family protein [bacterium]